MFNSLRFRILLFVVLMILGSTATTLFFVSRHVGNALTHQLEKEARTLIESVFKHVEIEYNSILFHKEAALTSRKQGLRNVIDLAFAVIDSFYNLYESGMLPEAEARKLAMETLRRMRYDDNVGYIWLNNLDKTMPTLDMHPVFPELEGRQLTDDRYYSAHGMTEHLLRAFVEVCEKDGAGYVDYLWPKPLPDGVTEDRPKLSYVKLFRPWGWGVGTGVYIDDIEAAADARLAAVKQEISAIIGSMDLGPNGYMYIFDGSSEVIIHPNLAGQFLKDITNNATGNDFFTDLSGSVAKSGGIIMYNWNKPTGNLDDRSHAKHCYTDYFEPLDWYISASYYDDEIFLPIVQLKHRIVAIASGFVIIALLLSFLLSRNLAAPLQRLAKTAEMIEKEGMLTVQVPICGTNETRELGRVLSDMLVSLQEREQQLKQTEMMLLQSRKMDSIGQLAGGIAHDFNNMLGAILGFGELLLEDMEPESETAGYVQAIIRAAENAADLTGKLLAFSRQAKNLSTPIDVHETIASAMQLLARSIDKRIVIKQELAAEASIIIGDPSQLQNALLNLGLNARDAMPDGGSLTIATSNTQLDSAFCRDSRFDIEPGLYILVRVEDSGCGIPKELQEKIFEPFFTTKEVGKGTGLGLAAVYGTIKDHGGAIHVYSEAGQGTTFHLYLPVALNPTPPSLSKDGVEADIDFHGSGCVLIIDDEGIFRSMAERLFLQLGYSVITAGDGLDGIEKYKEHKEKIDLVVLDMIMPHMDGKDCYYAIRKLNPSVKVLLSSGFTRNRSVSALLDDGVAGFIKKPYRRVEVCQMLSALFPDSALPLGAKDQESSSTS